MGVSRSAFGKMMWRVPEIRSKIESGLRHSHASHIGTHHSEETKAKMRAKMKGRRTSIGFKQGDPNHPNTKQSNVMAGMRSLFADGVWRRDISVPSGVRWEWS